MIDEQKCFVAKVPESELKRLKQDLLDQGFELTEPQYTHFQAKKEGLSCTVYTSNKITVQGKKMRDFIQFYLEPEILKTFSFGYTPQVDTTARIGVDEAGKGDFFGPLSIAAVYAQQKEIEMLLKIGVKDSKKLSDDKVLDLADKIRKSCACTTVNIGPKKYNELYANFKNLNRLLAWGHATAIDELSAASDCKVVIVDKFAHESVVLNALKRKNIDIIPTQRIRAEEDIVVAAASIMARSTFLKELKKLSEKFGTTFPKGASKAVIKAGKEFVREHGEDRLPEVAKCHFKTKEEVLL